MGSNMNMLQLIQLLKNNPNPQQFVLSMLEQQAGSNPLFANLLQLAKQGNTKEIEQIARNIYAEKGMDFDTEFNNFKQRLGY